MANAETYKPVDRNMNFKNLKRIRDRGYESGADPNGKIHTYNPEEVDNRLTEMAAIKVIDSKIRLFEELMVNDPYFQSQPVEQAKLRFAASQLQLIKHEIKEVCQ